VIESEDAMAVRFNGTDGVELVGDLTGRWGDPLVVLLHGGGQTRFSWGETAVALADRGFLALSVDARGHGESDWSPDGVYSVDRYASDLRRVVDEVGRPAALVGASLGGLTSIVAAGEDPRVDCTALVLVDVTPRMNESGKDAIAAFMLAHPDGFATVEEAADAVSAYLPHRPRPRDVGGLRKNLRHRDDGRYYWHWDPRMLDEHENGPGSVPPERFEKALAGLAVPVLLVRGGMSEIVGESDVEAFRAVVPSAEYVDVPDAAHMIAGDRNDIFTASVVDFLDRNRSDIGAASGAE
jgi:pimeloyl-ACP methyl ester carboxylesterase